MKLFLKAVLFLILVPGLALAQEKPDHKAGAQGHVFFAPTRAFNSNVMQFGGGGEALLENGFGLGADIGYLTPYRDFREGLGLLSANASYHALNSSSRVVPFVTGGYSLMFREGAASGLNFGGGVNYWMSDRVGLRLEVRDHVMVQMNNSHVVQFRVGLSFR